MGNNIELFDRYIDEALSAEEKEAFEKRLSEDPSFASDFRIYLFILDGIYKEAEQEDTDFGLAMKKISPSSLRRLLFSLRVSELGSEMESRYYDIADITLCGYSGDQFGDDDSVELTHEQLLDKHEDEVMHIKAQNRKRLRFKNILWIGSVAAMFIIGIFTFFTVRQIQMDRVDNIIVAYNYIPESNRGWESITGDDLPALEKAYRDAPADDMQAGEEAGMRLAMAYLKLHDRAKAKTLLNEMCEKFADNEEFTAQCKRILEELK